MVCCDNDLRKRNQQMEAPGHRASDISSHSLSSSGAVVSDSLLQLVIDAWPSITTQSKRIIALIVEPFRLA